MLSQMLPLLGPHGLEALGLDVLYNHGGEAGTVCGPRFPTRLGQESRYHAPNQLYPSIGPIP